MWLEQHHQTAIRMTLTRSFNSGFHFFRVMSVVIYQFHIAVCYRKLTLYLETTTNTAKAF
ncbi:Uncharacterised protein [Mycobacteroides abscessus subsp. abscessus]|nr:Uncharacterised protein [Mycobacteroides abscessus subsp. abscessus]